MADPQPPGTPGSLATLPHLRPLPLLAGPPGPRHIAAGRPGSRPRLTPAGRAAAGGLPLPGTARAPHHRPHRPGTGPVLARDEWRCGGGRAGQPPPTPEGLPAAGAGELALMVACCVASSGDISPKWELTACPPVPTLPLPPAPRLGLIPRRRWSQRVGVHFSALWALGFPQAAHGANGELWPGSVSESVRALWAAQCAGCAGEQDKHPLAAQREQRRFLSSDNQIPPWRIREMTGRTV